MINRLTELYSEKGSQFIEKLFSSPVSITEQTKASAFAVERRPDGLLFYKKESDRPISEVDRALIRFYEPPIKKIESLPESVKASMPIGWRFAMEYSVHESNPKLHLTHIHVRNRSGEVVRTINDKETLDIWAKTIKVMPPRIVFEGMVTPEAKTKILDFLYGERNGSFVSALCEAIGAKAPESGELVIRFNSESPVLAKVVDDIFENLPESPKPERNDIYNLTVLDFVNFIADRGIKRYKPVGKTAEQRYLSFVCRVFNDFFYSGKAVAYDQVDFMEPEFMKSPEFDVNDEMIPDKETLSILKNPQMRRLFKIVLAAFRKRKRKESGVMTKQVLTHFNAVVDEIKAHVSLVPETVSESAIPSFMQFRSQIMQDEDEDEDDENDTSQSPKERQPPAIGDDFVAQDDEPEHGDFDPENENGEPENENGEPENQKDHGEDAKSMDVNGLMTAITSVEATASAEGRGDQKVNVVVGRFQPLHNGHMAMAEQMFKINGHKCVFVAVHTGANRQGKSPISKETLSVMFETVIQQTEHAIGYAIIQRGLLEDVVKALRPSFEPVLWGAGADRYNGYLKQAEYNTANGNPLALGEEFDILRTERVTSGTSIRKMIEDDDYTSFKRLVPAPVASMWTLFRKDVLSEKNK